MELMKKVLAAMLALGMVSVMFAGCGAADAGTVEQIKEAGEIVMYTDAAFPPFEYVEGQDVKGVDVEIGLAIAEELGVELKVENVKFDSIVASVQSGKADFGAAGMTITDERKEAVDFSIEYYTSVQYVIFPEAADYDSMEDLAGLKVGVQLGTTGDFLVSDCVETIGLECKQYANGIEAAQDMMAGRVDAVVLDKLPAESIVKNNAGLKCVALTDAEPESYGICVAKGNESLLEIINTVLEDLIAEGKIESFVVAHSGV